MFVCSHMLMFRHPLCCWNAMFPLCTFAKALKGEDPTLIDNTPPPSHPPADTSSDISPLSNHPTSSMRSQGQPGSHPSFARGGREGQQAVSAFNAISLLFIIHVCTPPTHPPCNRPLAPPPSCHHCLIAIFCFPLMIQLPRLFIVTSIRMEKEIGWIQTKGEYIISGLSSSPFARVLTFANLEPKTVHFPPSR